MRTRMTEALTLPKDGTAGALAGRVWRPDVEGPSVVAVRADGVFDISHHAATMRDLAEHRDAVGIVRDGGGERVGSLGEILANTPEVYRNATKPWLLPPIDLQAVKAAGVTFARSMVERVIEEQAKGAPEKAEAIRRQVQAQLGGDLRSLKPGSKQALALKQTLIAAGAWSQYLEVGIGEDAEIFTKAQPLSAVGHGMTAGLHPRSTWNNPEPEVALAGQFQGRDRRRDARQRRQPARFRGALGAAAIEGQGQQRVRVGRAVHSLLRQGFHARYGPRARRAADRRRARRIPPHRQVVDEGDRARSGGSRRRTDRADAPLSRMAPSSISARCSRRARIAARRAWASRTRSGTSS